MSKYNPNIHRRRSIRLKGYDYSQKGLYFVTICTQNRECLFGEIIENKINLNIAGKMVENIWLEIPQIFPDTKLHEYIIMPNHFHAIVEITTQNIKTPVGAHSISARNNAHSISARNNAHSISARNNAKRPETDSIGAEIDSAPTVTGMMMGDGNVSLPKIMQTFKRYTTIEYIKMVKQNLLPPFEKRIWQRNYYEHIIRNEKSYLKIAEYIMNNPVKWNEDKYYVNNL